MRNDIQPNLQTIGAYFQKYEFYIPSFQRPYSWQVAQCEQLIEDIERHQENFDHSSQDNYFFGAILIAQESGEDHDLTLIDGQQRTTTFMLLLKALLIKINVELRKLSNDSVDDAKLIEKLKELKNKMIDMLYNLNEDDSFDYRRGNYHIKNCDTKYVNDSISELYASDMNAILLANDLEEVKSSVIKIFRRQKDNKFSNFYKNFRYFHNYCTELTNTQVRDFSEHFIKCCQVITITSFNTDQAINIFNSLNGTGVPLTPIEVIVSSTTASALDRKTFEYNWKEIMTKADNSDLDLNQLMTHYIFMKLSQKNGTDRRNPGIRAFFKKYKVLLKNDIQFTDDLDSILNNYSDVSKTLIGQILTKFNGNLKPFISSYLFFRDDKDYLKSLLKIGALLELTEYSYSHGNFKTFLENINIKYSQTNIYSTKDLIAEVSIHINKEFSIEEIERILKESGVSTPIIFLNEYLFSIENDSCFNLFKQVDIEHIMPKSGINRDNIIKDAGLTDQEEFYEYAEKAGNKILLESTINRGLGDAWFRTKKENSITSHRGYIGSQFPIAQELVKYPKDTWGKEDIDLATDKVAKRIVDFIFN